MGRPAGDFAWYMELTFLDAHADGWATDRDLSGTVGRGVRSIALYLKVLEKQRRIRREKHGSRRRIVILRGLNVPEGFGIPVYEGEPAPVPVPVKGLGPQPEGKTPVGKFMTLMGFLLLKIQVLGKKCWAGNKFLGQALNRGVRQVSNYLARAKALGLIRTASRKYWKHGRVLTRRYIMQVEKGKAMSGFGIPLYPESDPFVKPVVLHPDVEAMIDNFDAIDAAVAARAALKEVKMRAIFAEKFPGKDDDDYARWKRGPPSRPFVYRPGPLVQRYAEEDRKEEMRKYYR